MQHEMEKQVEVTFTRLRRTRMTARLRNLVRETHLHLDDLVYPLFVCPGRGVRREVESMPGVFNLSIDELIKECHLAAEAGIRAVLLFGIPEHKDQEASEAWREDGIVQRALRNLRAEFSDELVLVADTCLCEYTSHGHCGMLSPEGEILNDPTLELLARAAVAQAAAGADIIAPSDMMDGRVAAIRRALDENRYATTPILSYAVKYASAFYGPFRDAAQSAPKFGDRKSHQMDPANAREALREAHEDIREGADMIMVKPAGPCLDIISILRRELPLPLAAYQVSGEYAMIRAASRAGWINEQQVIWESATAIKRAGADVILTYFAPDLARMIKKYF